MEEYTRIDLKGEDNHELGSEEIRSLLGISQEDALRNKLGTLSGVFVPCCLNIMGVILFLRMGWSVGQSGVLGTLLIFLIAETQTVLTVLSLTAIVTNGSIKGGGSYYMVSRSLGPALGGAIGLLFYLAYAVGAAFYVIGFAEELQYAFFPHNSSPLFVTAIGSAVLAVILAVSLLGARYFTRVNTLVFTIQYAAVLYALGSFWASGPSLSNLRANLWEDYQPSNKCQGQCDFRAVFAIVFPAATGIMEGANLSGDLRDPRHSIGRGTLMAISAAVCTYLAIILSEAATYSRDTLRTNDYIMQDAAAVPQLVITGILISASSSALGAVFGGSRVLQALARDDLFPRTSWLGKGSAGADEPRRAVLFTWAIAQACLFLGSLDVVAPIISMFFCLSYAITNFAALLLRVSGTPNFRPTFRYFSAWSALAGGILNLAVMFWLEVWYASLATITLIAVFVYLSYRSVDVQWGDVSQALLFHQVRKYLLRLDETKAAHGKLWRPSLLHLCAQVDGPLSVFCNRLKKGGLYVLGAGLVGDFEALRAVQAQLSHRILGFVRARAIKAFPQVCIGESARSVCQSLVLLGGLGGLAPNTVVVDSWRDRPASPSAAQEDETTRYQRILARMEGGDYTGELFNSALRDQHEYMDILGDILLVEKNLIVAANVSCHYSPLTTSSTIDVWLTDPHCTDDWNAFSRTALILVQLAHILYSGDRTDTGIRVLLLTWPTHSRDLETRKLRLFLAEARIDVLSVHVFHSPVPDNCDIQVFSDLISASAVNELMAQQSAQHAEMCFVYLPCEAVISSAKQAKGPNFIQAMSKLTQNLPQTFFVSPGDQSDLMSRDL